MATEVPKRLTREQLAAALAEALHPRQCPNCGKRWPRVLSTPLQGDGSLRRYFACRECDWRWSSEEKARES